MNRAQLTVLREMADQPSLSAKTLTAREMAMKPHRLSKGSKFAMLENGEVFVWNQTEEKWQNFSL